MHSACARAFLFHYRWRPASAGPERPKKEQAKTAETLLTATTGLGLADLSLAKLTGAEQVRDKVALLVGGVSGYYLGHWLFARSEPACDANEVLHGLQQVDLWQKATKELCRRGSLYYVVVVNGVATPLVSHLDAIEHALSSSSDIQGRDVDLVLVAEIRQSYQHSVDPQAKVTADDILHATAFERALAYELVTVRSLRNAAFGNTEKFWVTNLDELDKQQTYKAALIRYSRVATDIGNDGGLFGIFERISAALFLIFIGASAVALSLDFSS